MAGPLAGLRVVELQGRGPGPFGQARLADVFKTRRFDEWRELLEGTQTCFAPVLTLAEAPAHPHNVERGTFVEVDGVVQPAPAPRFSRTPPGPPGPTAAAVSYTHLRAHETRHDLVCRLLLEKKK